MEIINHPLCTQVLAAPPGTEDEVSPLPVMHVDGVYYSFWKPDAEELALLNAGHALALGVYAPNHPVVSLGVTRVPV